VTGLIFDRAEPDRRMADLKDDLFYMGEALVEAAVAAAQGEVPVGAVVVRGDEIIARGHNRRSLDPDPTAHAELLAMRTAAAELGDWRLEGCRVYVTLEPCPMCAGAMVLARIDRCIYGCADPKGGFLGTLGDLSDHPGLNHRFAVTPGVMAEQSSAALRDFFRSLRAEKKRQRARLRQQDGT